MSDAAADEEATRCPAILGAPTSNVILFGPHLVINVYHFWEGYTWHQPGSDLNHFLMNLSREAPSRRSAGFAQNAAAELEAAAPASEP